MTVKRNLLLLSNSTLHPTGYLEYAADHIQQFLWGGPIAALVLLQVLFVPYALRKQDEYAATARKAFESWGFTFSSIHTEENPYLAASKAQVTQEKSNCLGRCQDII